ncbi:hypothetical protein [Micromonospora sp. WMMD708]|uniref:hypothetical protein n=1 Tax=Micromonospora sp. WMMD708 TaxID=3403464 RepID=UPI003BF5F5FA
MDYPWLHAPAAEVAATARTQLGWEFAAGGVRVRLTEVEAYAGTGEDQAALAAGVVKADARLAEIRDRLASIATGRVGVDLADTEAVWDAIDRMEVDQVRTIIETACQSIRLMPRRKGAGLPKGDDVQITWRTSKTEGLPIVG